MFRVIVHLQRFKTFLTNYFQNFEHLKSIFVASIAIIFSAFLFFGVTWGCTTIQTVVSTQTSDENIFGRFGNAFSIFGEKKRTDEAGIYSTKSFDNDFSASNRVRRLIVDTDGSVDDAIALFMVLSERIQPAQVLAITTVFGHTDVQNATKNILRTLKVLKKDKDIPIYQGATVGILKYSEPHNEREYYFGYDGYGQPANGEPSVDDLPKYHAVLAIIDAVKKYPGEVTIFCTGPLTNIALVIRIYPEFVRDVRQLYISGGSVYRLDAMDSNLEFNFQQDPDALKIVFDPRIRLAEKIYSISWENVSNMKISLNWRVNVLGKIKSRKISTINRAEAKAIKQMKENKLNYWTCPSAVLVAYYLKTRPPAPVIKPRIRIGNHKIHKLTLNQVDKLSLPKLNRMQFEDILTDYLK